MGEIAKAVSSHERSRANLKDLFLDKDDHERNRTLGKIKDREKELQEHLGNI